MSISVVKTITGDPENYDEIVPFGSDEGKAFTTAVLEKAGYDPSAEATAEERASLALLTDVEPATLETAVLFHAMLSDKRGLTVAEVAELLSISEKLVRSLLDDGEIVGWRVKRRIVVSTKSLEAYLEENPY